jgi:hypothetical protein
MLNFWGWITEWWHAQQRAIDVQILWPTCKAQARDLDHAHQAFKLHASNDEAWLSLGTTEMVKRIERLK